MFESQQRQNNFNYYPMLYLIRYYLYLTVLIILQLLGKAGNSKNYLPVNSALTSRNVKCLVVNDKHGRTVDSVSVI